jgi:hypothetical protein
MGWKLFCFVPIILLLLVGCGLSPASATAPIPETLQVSRDTGTSNHFSPLKRTVTEASAVQTLYKTALALPKNSNTGPVHSCPSADDLVYHLFFYQNGVLIESMDMNPSGCPYITINKNDGRPLSQTFIKLFAQTIGIPLSQLDVQPIPQPTKPLLH